MRKTDLRRQPVDTIGIAAEPGLPALSTLPTCVRPLTRPPEKVGFADRASRLWANISTHFACGPVKSGDREPYHDTSTRPCVPAASEGITLSVGGDRIGTYRLYIQAAMSAEKEIPIVVTVRDGASGESVRHGASFRGPGHP